MQVAVAVTPVPVAVADPPAMAMMMMMMVVAMMPVPMVMMMAMLYLPHRIAFSRLVDKADRWIARRSGLNGDRRERQRQGAPEDGQSLHAYHASLLGR